MASADGNTVSVPELIAPDPRVQASFLAAHAEIAAGSRPGWAEADRWLGLMSAEPVQRIESLADPAEFAAFCAAQRRLAEEDAPRPAGYVADTVRWWVDGAEWLGRLSIRHRLTRQLLDVGGHIGYVVRPSARRRGHASAMLTAALPVARRLGIDQVLVTCDHDNVASRRVIEKAGGELEDRRGVKLRYWVSTRHDAAAPPPAGPVR